MWHTSQCAGTDQRGTIRKKFPPKGGWDRWHERNRRHSAQKFAEEFYSDWTCARITYPSRITRREKKKDFSNTYVIVYISLVFVE